MPHSLTERPRRLRQTQIFRDLVAETQLSLNDLMQPYFLHSDPSQKDIEEPIQGFSEVSRWGSESLKRKLESDLERGLRQFLLFGTTQSKDEKGSDALRADHYFVETMASLKRHFGADLLLASDVCLCPFTSHGHCGIVSKSKIDNDRSLEHLSSMALVHAQAGIDMVAPSDMMDGRVRAIRNKLDENGYQDTAIMAYTAKYCSAYYGPFREALDSNPQEMGRESYQMDWKNAREAQRELRLDIQEGADIVMVKPALAYLDIIKTFSEQSDVPVAAYSVSGEYEMVKQMAKSGLTDEKKLALENLTAIKRAGASLIITYFATHIAEKRWLR